MVRKSKKINIIILENVNLLIFYYFLYFKLSILKTLVFDNDRDIIFSSNIFIYI